MAEKLASGDIAGMLDDAERARKNFLVLGGTSTGKTTSLNALIREIPAEERLILIEDRPELRQQHDDLVGLLSVRGKLGEPRVAPPICWRHRCARGRIAFCAASAIYASQSAINGVEAEA